MGARPQTTTTNGTTSGTSSNDFNNWLNGLTTTSGQTSGTTGNTGQSNTSNVGTTNTGGWAPAQSGLQDILTRAGTLSQGSYWTPTMSNNTQAAMSGLAGFGQTPTQTTGAAVPVAQGATQGFGTGLGLLSGTAGGQYLNGNPYMDAALKTSLEDTANRVNQQFSGAGRYGSAAHSGALARELGNIESNARMQNYNTERGYQNAAGNTLFGGGFQGVGAAQAADASRLQQLCALTQSGQMQDAYDQAVRQAPLQAVDWYKSTALPIAGTGQSGTTTNTGTGATSQNGWSSGTSSGTQQQNNTGGGTNTGTQSGTSNMQQQVQQAQNPWGMIGGAALTGLGLMTGNPMLIGSGVSGLAGGGGSSNATGSLWPSLFSSGGGGGAVGGPWATSVFPAGG